MNNTAHNTTTDRDAYDYAVDYVIWRYDGFGMWTQMGRFSLYSTSNSTSK